MTPAQYIDLIKERNGLKTDRQVAKALKIDPANVVEYRKGAQNFGPDVGIRVAELADVPPSKVAKDMMAARATSESLRKKWIAAAAVTMAITPALIQAGGVLTRDLCILC